MKVSDDYSYALAGFQAKLGQACQALRNREWSAAYFLLSRLQERVEQAKWHAKERMTE